nr:molybdenum cofactor guanylyltransferase [Kordiimonas laminariae]
MIAKTDIAGLVIAGGTSKRFGSDKYKAELLGKCLLDWSVANLQPYVADIALNLPVGASSTDHTCIYEEDNLGPLSAVITGMRWAREQGYGWLLSTPVDVPVLPSGLHDRLIETGCSYTVADDGPHGLCALWSTEEIDVLQMLLVEGKRSVKRAHQFLGNRAVFFPASKSTDYFNINTQADLAQLKTFLE